MLQQNVESSGRKVWIARLCAFARSESGAVTVDWVVLTAAAVGLCIGMFSSVNSGLVSLGEIVGDGLANAQVADLGVVNEF
jgi:hypothetical protein